MVNEPLTKIKLNGMFHFCVFFGFRDPRLLFPATISMCRSVKGRKMSNDSKANNRLCRSTEFPFGRIRLNKLISLIINC